MQTVVVAENGETPTSHTLLQLNAKGLHKKFNNSLKIKSCLIKNKSKK